MRQPGLSRAFAVLLATSWLACASAETPPVDDGEGGRAAGGTTAGRGGGDAEAGAGGNEAGRAGGRNAGAGGGDPAPMGGQAGQGSGGTASGMTGGTGGMAGAGGTVAPQLSGMRYRFAFDDIVFEVDPTVGGRITTFSIAGKNVLTGPEANAINWGSTLWPAPQDRWMPNWPPPVELDNQEYTATVMGSALVLEGKPSARVNLSMRKRFAVDRATRAVVITYTLTNTAPAAASWAPWEVTRVGPGGLSFFPVSSIQERMNSPAVTQSGGVAWYQWVGDGIQGSPKLFADGASRGGSGWLAHVVPADRILFVKSFADVPADEQAPGEGEIEIYVDGGKKYIELEQQGAYGAIAAGASVDWTVRWTLRRLPAGVSIAPGSQMLLDAVAASIAN